MTDLLWHGKEPEVSDEDKVQAAKDAIGKPVPVDALEEARQLREMIRSGNRANAEE